MARINPSPQDMEKMTVESMLSIENCESRFEDFGSKRRSFSNS